MPHPLIALTGYSRSGKDTAANALVSIGYERRAFGDIIKSMVDDADYKLFSVFHGWLKETGRNQSRIDSITYGWNLVKVVGVSPFTQDDDTKLLLRPLLEDYGIWKYKLVTDLFFSIMPKLCVNSRLCRAAEGKRWRDEGGIIVEIVRPGNKAHTEVEAGWVKELNDAGLIDITVHNNGFQKQLEDAIKDIAANPEGLDGVVLASRY
jgi:hypothetical protein